MKRLLNTLPLLVAIALIVYAFITHQPTPQLQALTSVTTQTHLKLGNPSNANTNDLNNYLLEKPQFVM